MTTSSSSPTLPTDQILSEKLVSLSQAAARLPGTRPDRPVHPSTILRWILRGCRGADGRRVRLEGARLGTRWATSVEALGRFVASLTPTPSPTPMPRSPAARARASAAASAELDRRLN